MRTDLRRHQDLIAELDELFPAKTPTPGTPLDEIMFQSGKRCVIEFLKQTLSYQEQVRQEEGMEVLGTPQDV